MTVQALRRQMVTSSRFATVGVMLLGFVYFAVASRHWALMVDSAVMHYVIFLMHHGARPYSQITDNNMPGAYMTEAWAMSAFGRTDLAWRMYEYFLLIVMGGAMIVIAKPYDWVAGIYAAGFFALLHGSEGPWVAVEREEVIAVLLIVGYACLFTAVRLRRPWMMLVVGFAGALAGSIKPTFLPLVFLLLFAAGVVLRKRSVPVLAYTMCGCAGIFAIGLLDLSFLLRFHALRSFLFILRVVTPTYAELPYLVHSTKEMVILAVPKMVLLLAVLGALLVALDRYWNWEKAVLVLGAGFGLASFFLQHKGFQHHRYPFLACLLLFAALELFSGLRKSPAAVAISLAGIAFTLIYVVPLYVREIHGRPASSELTAALESDLQQLGPPSALQGGVQCLDLVYGCLNALYHLQTVESAPFTGDLLLFSATDTHASHFYRQIFWRDVARNPPKFLVVTNQWFGHPDSFHKLSRWPAFENFLQDHYVLARNRTFPHELLSCGQEPYAPGVAPAYRIYLLR